MLGVVQDGQDAQGAVRVRPVVRERGIEFPVLVDRAGALAATLEPQVVPTWIRAVALSRPDPTQRSTFVASIGEPCGVGRYPQSQGR